MTEAIFVNTITGILVLSVIFLMYLRIREQRKLKKAVEELIHAKRIFVDKLEVLVRIALNNKKTIGS